MSERKAYKKWLVVLVHALAWVLVFTLPEMLKPDRNPMPDKAVMERNKTGFEVMGYIFRVLWIGFFYLHTFILLPRFAFKRKWWSYIASIVGIIIFWMVFSWVYFNFALEGFRDQPFNLKNSLFYSIIPTVFLMVFSTTYRLIMDRINADRNEREKVNENLKTELSLLRSQVSPHFMFNVLNNMVALARKKSDLLEPSLIKLSQLMRYMLYETHQRASIQKEVEYLQSYIDLQKQRFGESVNINTSFDIGDGHQEIEPMLLIPFVENAFKHGVVMVENPRIDISMRMDKDLLLFRCSNNFVEGGEEVKDSSSGIGLVNVTRRLELLYPNKHKLEIKPTMGNFEVTLQINLT